MKLSYHPDGAAEPTVYEFDPADEYESDLERLEKEYSKLAGAGTASVDMLMFAAMQGQSSARRAILWYVERQAHPGRRIQDVNFRRRELELEASRGDLLWLRHQILTQGTADPSTKDQLVENIDAQIAEMDARASTFDGEVVEGKASSPDSELATG